MVKATNYRNHNSMTLDSILNSVWFKYGMCKLFCSMYLTAKTANSVAQSLILTLLDLLLFLICEKLYKYYNCLTLSCKIQTTHVHGFFGTQKRPSTQCFKGSQRDKGAVDPNYKKQRNLLICLQSYHAVQVVFGFILQVFRCTSLRFRP